MKKISIVIPCYNEEENILIISERIKELFETLPNYFYEVIFINDGSTDNTQQSIEKLSCSLSNIKYIELSRSFGPQTAVKAGIDMAEADAVISMDADLQHPVEVITKLLEKWKEGFDIVYTLRTYSKKTSFWKKAPSNLFYKILSSISDIKLEKGTSDFRLIDSSVTQTIRTMNESDIFLRGICQWVGFRITKVFYEAGERHSGKSKYNFRKLLRLALTGITSFSTKPLFIASYLGFFFSAASVLYIPYVIYSFWVGAEVSGWASIIMTIVFFGGLQLSVLGIIGIYLGKIFKQTKNRPLYIVKRKNL